MAKSVVSIVKGKDPEKMVAESLALLGGAKNLIKSGSTVVIKTNAITGNPPEYSMCTNPEVLAAVIRAARKAGAKEIILTEGQVMDNFERSGQKKAAEDAGVDKIINLLDEKDLIKMPIRDHKGDVDSIVLPRFLVEADHFINLPIFKTHVSMIYTAAIKNIFGLLSRADRQKFHWTGVSRGLMDFWSICRADINMVDMTYPGEGYGPIAPVQTEYDCIVAGKDPVAVDATCCRIVGLNITKVPYFFAIKERNLGNYAAKDIEIRGKTIKEVYKKIWTPYLEGFGKYPEYEMCINEGSCFLCEGLVAWSLERLKPLGEYEKNAGISIVTGKAKKLPNKPKKDIILMGNCVPKELRDKGIFVPGCPPWEMYPAWPIMDRKFVDDMWGWGRNYSNERMAFIEYEKKLRDEIKKTGKKAAPVKKAATGKKKAKK
jgi:uncharacterized protein (DUF362 family)